MGDWPDDAVVVVGSGSAGCVVAARLAEAGHDVVLMEAGPDLREAPPHPSRNGWRTYRESDWGLTSEAVDGRPSEPLYRGRHVGGTSSVTRFAMRGSPADFDGWSRLGIDGWGFDDVLPYFRAIEYDAEFGAEPWHGRGGPIPVTRYPELAASPYEEAVTTAIHAAGIASIPDHNRPGAEGLSRMPRNSRDGVRVTGADAFLRRDAAPPRLRLRTDAEVALLVIDRGEVVGVRLRDGSVQAAAWVVLCAGVYGSPALLLRSGVGPAGHLADVGVSVVADLPGVGANLADHPGFDLDTGLRDEPQTEPRMFSLATFRSSLAAAAEPPDLALWLHDPFGGPGEPAETWIAALLLTPQARGSVRLRSADPRDPVRITLPQVEGEDVRRLVEGTLRAVEVGSHPAVRRMCVEELSAPRSDELVETVRRGSESYPHTVGTCAMGPDPSAGAVVDGRGAAHAVGRLSIADASVLPTAPSGFPHLLSMVIAERVAEEVTQALTAH